MKSLPLVSVVIPSFNSAPFLPFTLGSVLRQDYPHFEVVLVDDGSTDETKNVVESFGDPRLRYFYLPNSGGPSKPRNVGVQETRGEYIFLFDSDDEMLPGKIRRSVAALEEATSAGLLFTNFRAVDQEGAPLTDNSFLHAYDVFQAVPKRTLGEYAFLIGQEDAYATLVYENFIGTSSVAIPRPVLDETGPFDESLKNGDDADMWFRIARHYDLVYLDYVAHSYRLRPGTVGSRSDMSKGPNRVKVLRKQFDLGVPPRLVKPLRLRIARDYFDIGYAYQCQNETKLARRNYLFGLREAVTWQLLKGVVVSFLGARFLRGGRGVRRWLGKQPSE